MENQITLANDLTLNNSLLSLEDQLERAATAEVDAMGADLTVAERNSVIQIHKLKLLNSVDFAALMLRGKMMRQIEDEALWATHPGGYQTMEEMAADQGISLSEYSDIRRLIDVVFPYMRSINIEPAVMWQNLGKSKCRELSSFFSVIIDGTELESEKSVNQSARMVLDNVAASLQAAGIEFDDALLRQRAVEEIVELAGNVPIREVRQRLRPDGTTSINANFITVNGRRLLLAEIDEDQYTMFNRRLSGHIDAQTIELPNDPRARANEAARHPIIRAIAELVTF